MRETNESTITNILIARGAHFLLTRVVDLESTLHRVSGRLAVSRGVASLC